MAGVMIGCSGGNAAGFTPAATQPASVAPTAVASPTSTLVPVVPSALASPVARGTIPLLPTATGQPAATGTPRADGASASALGSKPYLLLNQRLNEGLYATGDIDLTDVDDMFSYIFGQLPDQVTVYPSENYYYFIMFLQGRQFWGNMRLPAGRRDAGVLSFAYFEFIEFPSVPGGGLTRAKFYNDADGVLVDKVDNLTYDVRFNRKTVRFNLHPLRTDPPKSFSLGANEEFIERTFDESGIQYFLLFNNKSNYFFWVLNEEETVPDTFENLADDVVLGVRTGFAFWVDKAHQNRKVLASIRSLSVTRNDYFDGPFDQLADNYVDINHQADYMQRAFPSLAGRIDKYGYHTDSERGTRVAISAYGTYFTRADILNLVERAKAVEDPIQLLSRGGVPLPATPTAVPASPVASTAVPPTATVVPTFTPGR